MTKCNAMLIPIFDQMMDVIEEKRRYPEESERWKALDAEFDVLFKQATNISYKESRAKKK